MCCRRSLSPPPLATAFFFLEKKKKVLNSDPESVDLILIYTKEYKRRNKGGICRDAIIRQHLIFHRLASPCFLHRIKLCFQAMPYRCTHACILSKRTHSKSPKMKKRDCNVLDVILSLGREEIHQRRGNATVKPQETPKTALQSCISGAKFQLGKHTGSILLRRACIAGQTSLTLLFHIDKSTTYKRPK